MGWFSSKQLELGTLTDAAKNGTLPKLIEALKSAGGEQAWLGRSLRVDLATIVARPELAFPCIYNRWRWVPSPQQLLESWLKEQGTAPWARALRPPRFGLDGPLREEYRGEYAGIGGLTLDSRYVGTAGVGWDRQSGRRLPQPRPIRQPSHDWLLDRPDPHWGRCRIVTRDGNALVLDVKVNDDDSFTSFTATPDCRTIVSGGWFDDYAGTVCLFDTKQGKLRWRAELNHDVRSVTISDDGSTVVAFSSGDAVVLDASNGLQRRRLFVDAGHGALDATGRELATESGRVLRIWDLAAPASEAARWSDAGQGWVNAAFSPDGKRLLTGQLLCDARSGDVLARLQTDGPGYLEGGPPLEGRVLANDRFVELSPFAGITIWDAATGESATPSAEKRRFSLRHEVRFSRDGRFIVCGERGGSGKLRVLRVDDGEQLGELPHDGVTAFEVDRLARASRPRTRTAGSASGNCPTSRSFTNGARPRSRRCEPWCIRSTGRAWSRAAKAVGSGSGACATAPGSASARSRTARRCGCTAGSASCSACIPTAAAGRAAS